MSADLEDTETTEALLARVEREQDAFLAVLRVAREYAKSPRCSGLRVAIDAYDKVKNGR